MKHDEWIKRQRDLCYQQGRAWSAVGNAKTKANASSLREHAQRMDKLVYAHARVKVTK